MIDPIVPLTLTDADKALLRKRKIIKTDRIGVAHLWEPFRDTYVTYVGPTDKDNNKLWATFRFCAQMMLALDCTYWAFTWERILAWREQVKTSRPWQTALQKKTWEDRWTSATATLFFMGILPYSESIYKQYHMELGRKWLGEERARAFEERFVATATSIGYQYEKQMRRRGVSVLFAVMAARQRASLEELTKADFEAWETQTGRSPKVASSGVTMAQRVLSAMGYLKGEVPRSVGGQSRERFTWGRTAFRIAATFERFLGDLASTRRPGTVTTYTSVLRRFGDWLGEFDPSVTAVAQVRRHHIEAYKQAVSQMKVGDYVTPTALGNVGPRLGRAFSTSFQVRCISCVKTFFEIIEALEYAERPGRQLFLRGDVKRIGQEIPRFIPDAHWHRFIAEADGLTPELVVEKRLPLPYERTRAVLRVLLEAGLRASELCRLDTGCIVDAQDTATNQVTYWLRVPVGKLHNDRMIPIRPALVEIVDAWMRKRGPQPLLWDERANKERDFLFAWRGWNLTHHTLSDLIEYICRAAGVPRYTSHQFRHTLAVQWRKNGMRIETISRMLGHQDLRMTLRYAAVMPETVCKEFDAAFAAIDQNHRTTAQVRVFLSPEAHVAASQQWRESLWVDLGIGFCGLSAYLPCADRLACLPCPNFVPTEEHLSQYCRQRDRLIELRLLGENLLPSERKEEIDGALAALERRIVAVGGQPGQAAMAVTDGDVLKIGVANAGIDNHPR